MSEEGREECPVHVVQKANLSTRDQSNVAAESGEGGTSTMVTGRPHDSKRRCTPP